MYEEFLRMVPLFADLSDEDLTRLCRMVQEVDLPAGSALFHEGELADRAFVLHRGELEIVKVVDGRPVRVDTQHEPGTVIGEMALLEENTRLATVRALTDCHLLALDHEQVVSLLHTSTSAAKVILGTLTQRWRALEAQVHHNERMAQLGTLTAGIVHELNNPVAAVIRGSQQLEGPLDRSVEARLALVAAGLSDAQHDLLEELSREIGVAAGRPLLLDALTRADREDEIEGWLAEHGVTDVWDVAPTLVGMGMTPVRLGELARDFGPELVPPLTRWLSAAFAVRSLLEEISHGATRVAETVASLKSYVHLDQAPVQEVDIHQGIDDTLMFLRHKLVPDVRVRREYAADLPRVTARASQLNQVWTNLLENAADSVCGSGTIVVRTRREGAGVVVEIEDDGPGIDSADLDKVFDLFFTTKPPGQGTGLALGISHRTVRDHGGQITVSSRPRCTVFRVSLPVEADGALA